MKLTHYHPQKVRPLDSTGCYTARRTRALQHMTTSARSSMPYVMAILIVGATAVLTRLLWGFTSPAPAALFLVAVAISAFIGGTGPGLTAAIASGFAVTGLIVLLGDLHDVNAGQVLWILSLLPVALMI